MEAPSVRVCSKCGVEKSLSNFARHPVNGTRPECKPCQRLYQAGWRAENQDKVRAWDQANRGRKNATTRAWKRQNRERCSELEQLRNARKFARYVEDVLPLVLLELDDGVCGICGGDVDPLAFHMDHIIPLARGGEHSYANTQPAHPRCNASKQARLQEELA